jgi:hypothetical protein
VNAIITKKKLQVQSQLNNGEKIFLKFLKNSINEVKKIMQQENNLQSQFYCKANQKFEDQLQALSAQQVLAKASGLALKAKPIPRM